MKYSLFFILIASFPCYAEYFTRSGEVEILRTHSKDLVGEGRDWMGLKGVSSVGSCRTTSGYAILRIADNMDRAYSTALAAQMSGKRLIVNINDDDKDSTGACWVRWLNIDVE